MARHKTRKQKKRAAVRNPQILVKTQVPVETKPVVSQKTVQPVVVPQSQQSQTTFFSQTQVNLLYKDLVKTVLITVLIAIVLLSIFLYIR